VGNEARGYVRRRINRTNELYLKGEG